LPAQGKEKLSKPKPFSEEPQNAGSQTGGAAAPRKALRCAWAFASEEKGERIPALIGKRRRGLPLLRGKRGGRGLGAYVAFLVVKSEGSYCSLKGEKLVRQRGGEETPLSRDAGFPREEKKEKGVALAALKVKGGWFSVARDVAEEKGVSGYRYGRGNPNLAGARKKGGKKRGSTSATRSEKEELFTSKKERRGASALSA